MTRIRADREREQELIERLGEVARTGLPLADGLRAAADECNHRATGDGLRALAQAMDGGATLSQITQRDRQVIPPYIVRLLLAGMHTGNLPGTLIELAECHRRLRDHWRSLSAALWYPTTLLLLLLGVSLALRQFVVPAIRIVFSLSDEPSKVIQSTIWALTDGIKIVGEVSALTAVLLVALRLFGGSAIWTRMISSVPGFGCVIHWQGLVQFTRLLRLLLLNHVPLPDALRATAAGIRNANVSHATVDLAQRVEQGMPLAEAMYVDSQFPVTLVFFVRSAKHAEDLVDALAKVTQLFDAQIRMRCQLLEQVLPPIVFVLIGIAVVALFGGVLVAMTESIRMLSVF